MKENSLEKNIQKNKNQYDKLCLEYNKLFVGQHTDITSDTAYEYDSNLFNEELILESCILRINSDLCYTIDEINKLNKLKSSGFDKLKYTNSHIPLDVPVILLSGKIGYDNETVESIEAIEDIIDELYYNSLLIQSNQNKQIEQVAHNLRMLHKKYLEKEIEQIEEIDESDSDVDTDQIKEIQKEIKMINGTFNPQYFDKKQFINKYMIIDDNYFKGIFDSNGTDYFQSYLNENKYLELHIDNGIFKIINISDMIHYVYLKMKKIPKYFIIIEHSCSGLDFDFNSSKLIKYSKHFYKKHSSRKIRVCINKSKKYLKIVNY